MVKKTTFILAVFHFFCSFSFGQKIEFEQITDQDGLISGGIMCSYLDSYGFMWFGSTEGLSRYDGYSFTNFVHNPDDTTSIGESIVRCMYETQEKVLLIGQEYSGLCIFDREKEIFTRFRHNKNQPAGIGSDFVMDIYGDRQGRTWIATREGLDLFNTKTKTFTHYKPFPETNHFISSIAEDKDGKLWLYGKGYQVCRFDPDQKTFEYFTFSENINPGKKPYRGGCIRLDRRGNLWIGNEYHGLFRYNPETGECHVYSVENSAIKANSNFRILEDTDGIIWIGTDGGGVYRYDYNVGSLELLQHDPKDPTSLSSNAVYSLYESSPGILWIGLYKAGVNVYKRDKKKFLHFSASDASPSKLSQQSVLAIAKGKDNKILVGTDGGGLNIYDPATRQISVMNTKNSTICTDIVKSMLVDKQDNIWIGSYRKGLCKFNPETGESKNFLSDKESSDRSIYGDHVWSLCESSDGKIWIGLLDFGLNVFDPADSTFTHYPFDTAAFKKGLSSIYVIKEDSKKRIWIGSERVGLACFDPLTKSFKYFRYESSNPESISDNGINDIFEDSHGNIWLATIKGGLCRLIDPETGTFTHFTVNHGLSSNNIKSIQEDNSGNLWLSTDNGLCMFNPEEKRTTVFNHEDGVQGRDFNYNSSLKDEGGYLYFGGIHGFNVFHPDRIHYNKTPPQIVFTDFKIFNQTIKPGKTDNDQTVLTKAISMAEEVVLTYNDYIFSVEFAALDFMSPEKNQYAYKLEGFDPGWTYVSSEKRHATYTNLDPGKYTFRVIASNNDGAWNSEGATLDIIILPPWWMTWWFKGTAGVLLLSLVCGSYYFRIRSIKERNIILQQEVEKRTAEIVLQREEILNQKDELEKKKIELEHLNKTKDKFFSIIGHDLKGPVRALAYLAETLKKEPGTRTETEKELIYHIDRSSKSVKNLVVSLLEWARTQTGQVSLQPVNMPVRHLLAENIELHGQLASQKNIQLELHANEEHVVFGDYQMTSAIVRNILNNSIKYTRKGGEIKLSSSVTENGQIKISIADNGIGMPPEILNKLFSLDKGPSMKGTNNELGTGLGLIISNEFALLNNGKICAESTMGEGSVFHLILPAGQENIGNSEKAEVLQKQPR